MLQTWALKLDSYMLKHSAKLITTKQWKQPLLAGINVIDSVCSCSTGYTRDIQISISGYYCIFYSKDSHFEYTLTVEQLTEAKDHNINVFTHSPTWTDFHKLCGLQSGWVLAVMEWISEVHPWIGLLDRPSLCYTTLMIFIVLRNVNVGTVTGIFRILTTLY